MEDHKYFFSKEFFQDLSINATAGLGGIAIARANIKRGMPAPLAVAVGLGSAVFGAAIAQEFITPPDHTAY